MEKKKERRERGKRKRTGSLGEEKEQDPLWTFWNFRCHKHFLCTKTKHRYKHLTGTMQWKADYSKGSLEEMKLILKQEELLRSFVISTTYIISKYYSGNLVVEVSQILDISRISEGNGVD